MKQVYAPYILLNLAIEALTLKFCTDDLGVSFMQCIPYNG